MEDGLHDALPDAEESRTAERRLCEQCKYEIPLCKWDRHEEYCAAYFKRYSHAEKLIHRHGLLLFLRRALKVPRLTFSTLVAQSSSLVHSAFSVRGLQPPQLQNLLIGPELVACMEKAAKEGKVRLERNEAKQWPQEVAISDCVRSWLAAYLPRLLDEKGLANPSPKSTASQGSDPVNFENEVCIIELGAGGGELIHMLQCIVRTTMVLVDFYPAPRMVDFLYDGDNRFARIWKQVEDVTADDLQPFLRRVNIVIAKHLCGAGFDSALLKIQEWRTDVPVHLLAMAPCCQHGSVWATYVGRDWWLREGLRNTDFILATQKMNWKDAKNRETENRQVLYHIGCLFEALHAQGRKAWLEQLGYSTNMMYYIDDGHTMRNILFLASNVTTPVHAQNEQKTEFFGSSRGC